MKKTTFGKNFEAYFLGPKGENFQFYSMLLNKALEDHIKWREAFHIGDREDFITQDDKEREDFKQAQGNIERTLYDLRELLKKNQPFFSPRYIGHMNWEVMAAPMIAFFTAALYNPNNVAQAGSTGTSQLELEVGKDFAKLFGYDEEKAWGHICTGGTIANMEALWIARNMKVIPLVLKIMLDKFKVGTKKYTIGKEKIDFNEISSEKLISQFNPEEILELKVKVISKIKDKIDSDEVDNKFDKLNLQERGLIWDKEGIDTGVVFLPQTKHYSLKKTMDLLGIGKKNIKYVPVDEHFRIDMKKLEKMILEEKRPILAIVGVIGSTEESSVDKIDKIIKIRNKSKKQNKKGFHIHIDAAYGGYVRSLFLDENNNFMNKIELNKKLKSMGIIGDKRERKFASWPSDSVFKAFKALSRADTITVDPHKLGYVLYPAGGIAMKDKRMREAIQTFAPYVFPKPKKDEPDTLIGAYILEGSKPGAAAAAIWTAHRIMPLNINGYGKLIGETIDGAQALWYGLNNTDYFSVNDKIQIKAHTIVKPDINIVNYVFNFKDNTDLKKMNNLTEFFSKNILGPIPKGGESMLDKKFIVSDTNFSFEEYGDSPLIFLQKIGFSKMEWNNNHNLTIIRSTIMSPYLTPDYVDENYVDRYIAYLKKEIKNKSNEILSIFNKK